MYDRSQEQGRRRPLSVWELPKLLQSVHTCRKGRTNAAKERAHFAAILAFIYRNRFAVASQVRRRFRRYLPSDRTARRHLAEIESLGYVDVAQTNNTSPLWPKVYFVTRRGIKTLRRGLAKKGKEWNATAADRNRAEGYSALHVLHELFITEFLLDVWHSVDARPDLEHLTVQRRSLASHPAFRTWQSQLIPDALFVFRQQRSGMIACFVEIDMGTMSNRRIAEKYKRYHAWKESTLGREYLIELYQRFGARNPRPGCRILIASHDRAGDNGDRMQRLRKLAREAPGHLQNALWLTNIGDFADVGKLSELFSQRIWWHCGSDEPLPFI